MAPSSSSGLPSAIRHARVLLPTYVPLFVFILITAIANRWHYLVDLPVGIGLAFFSIHLADRLHRKDGSDVVEEVSMMVVPVLVD